MIEEADPQPAAELTRLRAGLAAREVAGDEAIRAAAGAAIDAFPGKLHSKKIDLILAAVAPGIRAAERERIAAALDEEASTTPCTEDAIIVRDCAALVRADFSYEQAERDSAETPNGPVRAGADDAT